MQLLQKFVFQFLIVIHLPSDKAITFLGIYPKEIKKSKKIIMQENLQHLKY